MYGGSRKPGRLGSGKRSSFLPTLPYRSSAPLGGQVSVGKSSDIRNGVNSNSSSEENFSLVSGQGPLDFAMIIRLTPNLVEEISRVEAQGGVARIKFDHKDHNTSGNVINVGDKNFSFTWSNENADLCSIYEERQSGEDGSGLLVESACAWRRLNVQRVLDESLSNHVKMLSKEAKNKLKSRKTIGLDNVKLSMKRQMNALATAEKKTPFKQKKEPAFKKRKLEPSHVIGAPLKPAVKGGQTASSVPNNPADKLFPPTSKIVKKGHNTVETIIPTPVTNKEKISSYEKKIPIRASNATVRKGKIGGVSSMDLQSKLISLLLEHPNGMSLKALQNRIGDEIPHSSNMMDPILKQIASYQAPGKYILKPGIDLENFKKPLSENGSSPSDNKHQISSREKNHDQTPASDSIIVKKILNKEKQENAQSNSKFGETNDISEKNDIQPQSHDLLGKKRVSENSGGPKGGFKSSGFESDSESGGSDNSSDSSSDSDSESELSIDSKEGSDEDVDIMSNDDEKQPNYNFDVSDPVLSISPIVPWRTEIIPVHNQISEKFKDTKAISKLHTRSPLKDNRGNGLGISPDKTLQNREQFDINNSFESAPQSRNEYRVQQPSLTVTDLCHGQKETILLENNNDIRKRRRDCSLDENSWSYHKYEKDEPELKGPINNFSQYEEYVQEYRDKFDSYVSLNKILETDRTHFQNLGENLESSKGKDMERYYKLLGQLKDSYYQIGPRHKRLKKVFIVLHEELKSLKQRVKDYALKYSKDGT